MREGSLLVAYPGPDDADEAVAVADDRADTPALRQAVSTVDVGAGGLWLADYTQLTMAAQFDDEAPTTSDQSSFIRGMST